MALSAQSNSVFQFLNCCPNSSFLSAEQLCPCPRSRRGRRWARRAAVWTENNPPGPDSQLRSRAGGLVGRGPRGHVGAYLTRTRPCPCGFQLRALPEGAGLLGCSGLGHWAAGRAEPWDLPGTCPSPPGRPVPSCPSGRPGKGTAFQRHSPGSWSARPGPPPFLRATCLRPEPLEELPGSHLQGTAHPMVSSHPGSHPPLGPHPQGSSLPGPPATPNPVPPATGSHPLASHPPPGLPPSLGSHPQNHILPPRSRPPRWPQP